MDDFAFQNWTKNATKGELLQAFIKSRSQLATLARAIVALKGGNDAEYFAAMNDYFGRSEEADELVKQIGGVSDGK